MFKLDIHFNLKSSFQCVSSESNECNTQIVNPLPEKVSFECSF